MRSDRCERDYAKLPRVTSGAAKSSLGLATSHTSQYPPRGLPLASQVPLTAHADCPFFAWNKGRCHQVVACATPCAKGPPPWWLAVSFPRVYPRFARFFLGYQTKRNPRKQEKTPRNKGNKQEIRISKSAETAQLVGKPGYKTGMGKPQPPLLALSCLQDGAWPSYRGPCRRRGRWW